MYVCNPRELTWSEVESLDIDDVVVLVQAEMDIYEKGRTLQVVDLDHDTFQVCFRLENHHAGLWVRYYRNGWHVDWTLARDGGGTVFRAFWHAGEAHRVLMDAERKNKFVYIV